MYNFCVVRIQWFTEEFKGKENNYISRISWCLSQGLLFFLSCQHSFFHYSFLPTSHAVHFYHYSFMSMSTSPPETRLVPGSLFMCPRSRLGLSQAARGAGLCVTASHSGSPLAGSSFFLEPLLALKQNIPHIHFWKGICGI